MGPRKQCRRTRLPRRASPGVQLYRCCHISFYCCCWQNLFHYLSKIAHEEVDVTWGSCVPESPKLLSSVRSSPGVRCLTYDDASQTLAVVRNDECLLYPLSVPTRGVQGASFDTPHPSTTTTTTTRTTLLPRLAFSRSGLA